MEGELKTAEAMWVMLWERVGSTAPDRTTVAPATISLRARGRWLV